MEATISEIVTETAKDLMKIGRWAQNGAVDKAAQRLAWGAATIYTEEGQNLLYDAARDLGQAGLEYNVEAVFINKTADYLRLDDIASARYFASRTLVEAERLIKAVRK